MSVPQQKLRSMNERKTSEMGPVQPHKKFEKEITLLFAHVAQLMLITRFTTQMF